MKTIHAVVVVLLLIAGSFTPVMVSAKNLGKVGTCVVSTTVRNAKTVQAKSLAVVKPYHDEYKRMFGAATTCRTLQYYVDHRSSIATFRKAMLKRAHVTDTATHQLPVLEIKYFPLKADGKTVDGDETGFATPLTEIRSRIAGRSKELLTALDKSTIYVKDPTGKPYIHRFIAGSIEHLSPIPKVTEWGQADMRAILNEANVCNWVDNKKVREVWIWMYHFGKVAPVESNMSMGRLSKKYWNYGTYGDVSNSYRRDDLPICEHTYTVYNFNNDRELGTMLENYGHQLETIFLAMNFDLYEHRFRGDIGNTTGVQGRCGNIHWPPNGKSDYDWRSKLTVTTTCSDWHPDGTAGATETIDCTAWDCDDSKYKIWWMQRVPGRGNSLTYKGKKLRNWWEFVVDFDQAIQVGPNLVETTATEFGK